MTEYYKVLNLDGSSFHGGSGTWHKPGTNRPGKWMPEITNISPCERGYHLVTLDQLTHWLGPMIWEAEGRGEHIEQEDKHVFSEARLLRPVKAWTREEDRWYWLECLEAIPDLRPEATKFLEKTRRFLEGSIPGEEYYYYPSPSDYYPSFSDYSSYFSVSYYSSFPSLSHYPSSSPVFSCFPPFPSWRTAAVQRLAQKLGIAWEMVS